MSTNEEREISVDTEQMDDDDDEQMDQQSAAATLLHSSAPTPVIVSVSPNMDEDDHRSSTSRQSPSHSPSFQVTPDQSRLLSTRAHLQVRQTLSEPGRNRVRTKLSRLSPTHLSPVQTRKHDLSKTLSMGAALDTASGPILWKPVESTGQRMSSLSQSSTSSSATTGGGVESMQQEGGDDSPNSTPSISPRSLPTAASAPTGIRLPWLGGQIPTQEQLEAVYKHIPSSHDQLELVQKQMMILLEQQQKAAAVSTSTGGSVAPPTTAPAEMFQFPLPLLTFGLPATPLQQLQQSSTASSSTTPSPTPSNSSTDSGIAGLSAMSGLTGLPTVALPTANFTAGESLTLGAQRRPLSESLSAPGYQTSSTDNAQYEALLKQFQVQQQHLLMQGQQMQQHYLEQQQRLIQQALLERKQFEEQQRQLAAIHLRQQQELQKKQQLLRQMQENQLVTLQRQQQVLLLHSLAQQQRASQLAQAQAVSVHPPPPQPHKPAVRRLSGKSSLTATSSNNSLHEVGGASDGIRDQLRATNHSPSLTPKASLTPTNSFESTASNNGRGSPHVGVASPSSGQETQFQGGTGLVYDTLMLKHNCSCGGTHPEHPGRLQSIWARLHETRVVANCKRLRARKASLAELQAIHSENHVRLYGRSTAQRKPGQEKKDSGRGFIQLTCGGVGVDRDTYWNEAHTSNAARMAAGSVIELADKVCSGEVKNGFAFVRPPGHHALPNQAMAFCYFNNVALAAKAMLSKNKRVAVVDWDIHHGNGTQHIFYDNPGILFISVHRYDNGTFFPGTGRPEEIGSGAGLGFNVNVAFSGTQNFQGIAVSSFGDAEYLAVFRSIVVPICREFKPDIILVSAGFNATDGHPPTLGGYSVTPQCYAVMTRMLMSVGMGRVALALEGGYELMSLCASAEACMRALLGYDLPQMDNATLERTPQSAAVTSAEKTIAYHKNYWRCLTRSSSLLNVSHVDAEKRELEEADTVSALASLSVAGDGQQRSIAMQTAV